MTKQTKLLILRSVSSYATAAEAMAHFGGAYALLALLGGVSKDLALTTAALIAASAIYDQRLSSRLAVLEDRLEREAKVEEDREAKKMEEETKR